MSNPSLKEQLQALATEKTQIMPKKTAKKPLWLEQAQYGVELLKAHFPQCFKEIKEVKPLKIGVKQDLVKALSNRDDIVIGDKACIVNSLAYYVNSPAYLKSVVAGAMRIDLEGNTAGVVTPEEAKYSVDCRQTRLQKKKPSKAKVNVAVVA